MTALERLKALASAINHKSAERWLTLIYLGFEGLLLFFDPIASMAMGVFLIAILIAATNF